MKHNLEVGTVMGIMDRRRYECPEFGRLADQIFDGSPYARDRLAAVLCRACQEPIDFAVAQSGFRAILKARSAFVEPGTNSREPVVRVHVLNGSLGQSLGDVDVSRTDFRLDSFLMALCQLLVSDDMRNSCDWLTEIPLRIAAAFLFFNENVHLPVFPARRWFIRRFLRPGCNDEVIWDTTDTATALFQSTFALGLAYMIPTEPPRNMPASVMQTAHLLDMANSSRICSTLDPEDTETRHDELQRDDNIIVMVSLIFNRLLPFTDPDHSHTDINSKVAWIRKQIELVLWLMADYAAGESLPLIARNVHPATLVKLQSIAEEMRNYITKPAGYRPDPLLAHIVSSTCDTRSAQAAVIRICELMTQESRRRSGIVPRYVSTREVTFFDFVTGLMRNNQLAQMLMLRNWVNSVNRNHRSQLNISTMLSEGLGSPYTAMLNRAISVWRFPPSVHRTRLSWSVDIVCELTKDLLPAEKRCVMVGYDNLGSYLVLPRKIMSILRMRMIVLALVSSNYTKTTAWYSILVQLLLCEYVDPDAPQAESEPFATLITEPVDRYARFCAATALAHWLRVPKHGNSNSGEFEGMPEMDGPAAGMYSELHTVADMLFKDAQPPIADDITAHMPRLNAFRAFIMIACPHYLSLSVIREVAQLHLDRACVGKRLCDILEVVAALHVIYSNESTAEMAACALVDDDDCGSSAGGSSAGKRASPASVPGSKRQRGRTTRRASRSQIAVHNGKYLLGVPAGVDAQRFFSMLSPQNELLAEKDPARQCSAMNAMFYELCIAADRSDWMTDFCVPSVIERENFNRALYKCSPSSLEMWKHTSTCIRTGLYEQTRTMPRDRYRLRQCFQAHQGRQAESFDVLVEVLCALEMSVCQPHEGKSKAGRSKKPIPENEREVVDDVARLSGEINNRMKHYYADRATGTFPLPVSCTLTQEDKVYVVEMLDGFLLVDIASDKHGQQTLAQDVPHLDPERMTRVSNREHLISPLVLSLVSSFGPIFPTSRELKEKERRRQENPEEMSLYQMIARQQNAGKLGDAVPGCPPRQPGV